MIRKIASHRIKPNGSHCRLVTHRRQVGLASSRWVGRGIAGRWAVRQGRCVSVPQWRRSAGVLCSTGWLLHVAAGVSAPVCDRFSIWSPFQRFRRVTTSPHRPDKLFTTTDVLGLGRQSVIYDYIYINIHSHVLYHAGGLSEYSLCAEANGEINDCRLVLRTAAHVDVFGKSTEKKPVLLKILPGFQQGYILWFYNFIIIYILKDLLFIYIFIYIKTFSAANFLSL